MKPLIFLSVFILLGFGMVGSFTATQAHGGSMWWFFGGIFAVAASCATIITYMTHWEKPRCQHRHATLTRQIVKTLEVVNHNDPTIEPNGTKDTILYFKKFFDCNDCGAKDVTVTYRA